MVKNIETIYSIRETLEPGFSYPESPLAKLIVRLIHDEIVSIRAENTKKQIKAFMDQSPKGNLLLKKSNAMVRLARLSTE